MNFPTALDLRNAHIDCIHNGSDVIDAIFADEGYNKYFLEAHVIVEAILNQYDQLRDLWLYYWDIVDDMTDNILSKADRIIDIFGEPTN